MKQTEVGLIPDDWEVVKLSKVAEIKAPMVNPRNKKYDYLPHIGNENIEKFSGKLLPYKLVGEENLISGKYYFKSTDVLYGKINPQFSKVTYPKFEGLCSADMYPLSANNEIIPEYLKYTLLTKSFYDYTVATSARSGMPKVNRDEIAGYQFALPPLNEQKKIAEALSDIDSLICGIEEESEKKKNIKTGAMQELLTGKRRLPGFAKSDKTKMTEFGEIPEDWVINELGEVSSNYTGLTYSPENICDYGTLVLRSSNIQNGVLAFDDNVFVDMQIPERAITKKDDILICVRNGSTALIGKSALITEDAAGMAFGAFMTILRTSVLDQKFLFYLWQSPFIQDQIKDLMGATINQITNKDIKLFQIYYPSSKEEQSAIATILTDMDSEINELESKLSKYKKLKDGMMQQLLTGKIRLN